MLADAFFNHNPVRVAQALLGKIICVRHDQYWLYVQIIETEAYGKNDKASHGYLGYTEKRKALFMSPGTIYMYYSRGADSLNISCRGPGNAVLIKSGIPYLAEASDSDAMIAIMQAMNPRKNNGVPRDPKRLCSGQTLLCRSLGVTVTAWDQKKFCRNQFYIKESPIIPKQIIQAPRLGISTGRDEHLLYRFVDMEHANFATEDPLRKRAWQQGKDYFILSSQSINPMRYI